MTGARRGWRTAAVVLVLAVPVLAGCDAAQQAQDIGQGVDKAADCAALVGELTGINWSDVQQAPAEAEQAAQKLDQRLREVDDADVKAAGEALRDGSESSPTPPERRRRRRRRPWPTSRRRQRPGRRLRRQRRHVGARAAATASMVGWPLATRQQSAQGVQVELVEQGA